MRPSTRQSTRLSTSERRDTSRQAPAGTGQRAAQGNRTSLATPNPAERLHPPSRPGKPITAILCSTSNQDTGSSPTSHDGRKEDARDTQSEAGEESDDSDVQEVAPPAAHATVSQPNDIHEEEEGDLDSSSSSEWSDQEMRDIVAQVSDDMLDASQVTSTPIPTTAHPPANMRVTAASAAPPVRTNARGRRTDVGSGKENREDAATHTNRRTTITIPPSMARAGSARAPLQSTQPRVRADTPRPAPPPNAGPRDDIQTLGPRPRMENSLGTALEDPFTHPLTARSIAAPRPGKADSTKRSRAERSPQASPSPPTDMSRTKKARLAHSEDSSAAGPATSTSVRASSGSGFAAEPTGRSADANTEPPEKDTGADPASAAEDGQDSVHSPSPGDSSDSEDEGPATALQLGHRVVADAPDEHMRVAIASSTAARSTATVARTPTPDEGFPLVDVAEPGWLFENQTHDQLAAWREFEGEKVIATMFGKGALDARLDGSQDATIGLIETQVGLLLQSSHVKASPPIAITTPSAPNSPPFSILIFNLSANEVKELLALRCLSTEDVTLLFFPFGIQLPRLILNFSGIANRTEQDVRRMAVVNMRADRHQDALLSLIELSPELTVKHSAKRVLNSIIKSAAVSSSTYLARRAVSVPVYSLFIDIPVSSADIWIRWRDTLRAFQWVDHELGTVTVRDLGSVHCEGCQAQTHFHWACPFTTLHEWKGKMPYIPSKRSGGMRERDGRTGAGNSGWRGGRGRPNAFGRSE